jgi:hypothetical protein
MLEYFSGNFKHNVEALSMTEPMEFFLGVRVFLMSVSQPKRLDSSPNQVWLAGQPHY